MNTGCKNLAEVAKVIMGQSPPGELYNDREEGLPLITGAGQFGEVYPRPTQFSRSGARESKQGDIIICIRATIGDLNWSDRTYYLGRGVAAIRPMKELDARYLWQWLKTQRHNLEKRATGTTFKQVRREDIEDLVIDLPTIDEQRRIASVLDTADGLREKRRQAINKLDSLLRSVFLDMFGEPVANPKKWKTSTFGAELYSLKYGPRFYNQTYSATGVPIIRISDLDNVGNLNFRAMPLLDVSKEDLKKYSVRPGDIIFARSGATVGKTALIPADAPTAIAGAYFIIMRFNETVDPLYARTVLASRSVQAIISSKSRQSAQQNFSGPYIRELSLPVPPLSLQIRFREIHDAIKATSGKQTEHLNRATFLFDSLQHKAFRLGFLDDQGFSAGPQTGDPQQQLNSLG